MGFDSSKIKGYGSKYLSYNDLQGREFTLKIRDARLIEQFNRWQKINEQKIVMSFYGAEKELMLNNTNWKVITSAYGPVTDNWVGKEVTIYGQTEVIGGIQKQIVRVKLPHSKQEFVPEINDPEEISEEDVDRGLNF